MSIREERKQQSRQALLNAALQLSTSGRSFSQISLREVTRQVGLVPTAFYRHFSDLDELGLELVDQAALHIKNVLTQLGQSYVYRPHATIEHSLDLFFDAVEQHPEQWIFLIGERWGGSTLVRKAIEREITFLIDDFAYALTRIESMQHIRDSKDLNVLANILMNASFNWAMRWMGFSRDVPSVQLQQQQHDFKMQTVVQIQLMFRGISNWHRPAIQTEQANPTLH
ncbi:TetR family transcriptional regulator [Acinetobacter sp. UBA6720]|uniref:TetR family transcriptional regulator n=1 Tax=Acinetobacter sp. UBA6720 TaxID=1945953 RepID=UPI0025BD3FE7|nr:TetR family transcriptional regulator [Acinetobacter sp. UBA6720]